MTSSAFPSSSEASPWYMRQEERNIIHPEGLVSSLGAGRTDIHNIQVPAGSYVVPADVVSGLGEGNTMAGAGVMDRMMHSNPYGIEGGGGKHGASMGPPRMKLAKGGSANAPSGSVPIVVAGGEMIYYPGTIAKKFGNLKKGHSVMDAFVKRSRANNVKTLSKLPGPKK